MVVVVAEYNGTAPGKYFESASETEGEIVPRGIGDRHLFGEIEEASGGVYEGLNLAVIAEIQLQGGRLGASGVYGAIRTKLQRRPVAMNERERNQ